MSENSNCKAAGDSACVKIISTDNGTVNDGLKEIAEKILPAENGNNLSNKTDENEISPLDIKEKCQEDLAKVTEEKSCSLAIKNKEEEELKEKGKEEINTEDTSSNSPGVTQLLLEIEAKTKERDNYHNKLMETEKKFDILETQYNALLNGKEDKSSLSLEVKNLKIIMAQTQLKLDDRIRVVANQENQINALMSQVSSLKDVVNITKDLLNIRNMEVKHLQDNVEAMEEKVNLEREKHNTMLAKMESAFKINLDLKQEYETQLRLFQELRDKYDKKVALLSEENVRLENIDKKNKTI